MQTLEKIRNQFPVTKNWIYLNHAAVSPLSMHIKEAVLSFLNEALEQGYTAAPKWHALIERARENSAALIGSDKTEIAFAPSTSAGLSYVAKGLKWQPGDNLLIPDCEFPSNVYPWLNLESQGVQVRRFPTQNGKFNLETLNQFADKKTRLLSLSSVQYGSGWHAPLPSIGEWCRKNQILFCVDAIQSLGVLPMNVKNFQIDFLASDAHKWLTGPEGIALFFCSKRIQDQVHPPMIGWKSVEHALDFDHIDFKLKKGAQKFEAGSDNVLGIHALNAAIELLLEVGIESIEKKVFELNDLLMQGIEKHWPGAEIISSLQPGERSGITAVKLTKSPEILLEAFLKEKIYLAARKGWLRISPHFYNTAEEIEILTQTGKKLLQ